MVQKRTGYGQASISVYVRSWPLESHSMAQRYRSCMEETSDLVAVDSAPDVDLYETLVRLVAGGVGEALERLRTLAGELDSADDDPESVGVIAVTASPAAMAFIGLLSEAPTHIRSATSAARRMMYPVERLAGVAVGTGAVVAEAMGVAGFIASVTEPTRTAISVEIDRLTDVGTAEYARGRMLSIQVFERSVNGMIEYLATSDELGDLVREQTLGVTGAAVQEIRETSAAVDGLTEGIFRKLLGRTIREIPPMPMANGE